MANRVFPYALDEDDALDLEGQAWKNPGNPLPGAANSTSIPSPERAPLLPSNTLDLSEEGEEKEGAATVTPPGTRVETNPAIIPEIRPGDGSRTWPGESLDYGEDRDQSMPLSEDMPARPKSPYGLQKHVGELYCRVFSEVYGLQTVSLRFFNVYGPAADPNGAYALVVSKFIKQALEGKPLTITGDGEQTRDFTHVSDVVRANLLAAESPLVGKGEVLNIGAGRPVSINTLAQLIGGKTVHIEARLEPRHTAADITRAQTLLGWKPEISIETGIAELKTLAKL